MLALKGIKVFVSVCPCGLHFVCFSAMLQCMVGTSPSELDFCFKSGQVMR